MSAMQQDVVNLFNEVADLSPTERASYFAEHQTDDELQRAAEELLAFDAQDSGPMPRRTPTKATTG